MAFISTTENNTLNELIGEVLYKLLDEHLMVCPYANYCVQHMEDSIMVYNDETHSYHYYKKISTVVNVSSDKVYVFEKQFLCSQTGKRIPSSDIFELYEFCAFNEFNIRYVKDKTGFYNNIPVIKTGTFEKTHFVFNLTDVKKSLLSFLLAQSARREIGQICVATEVIVNDVLPFFDCIKFDENDEIVCGENSIKCIYNFEFPKYFSKAQVKKLFELGMIKMVTMIYYNLSNKAVASYEVFYDNPFDYISVNIILSDESFNRNTLASQYFGSKENMHAFIKEQLVHLGI